VSDGPFLCQDVKIDVSASLKKPCLVIIFILIIRPKHQRKRQAKANDIIKIKFKHVCLSVKKGYTALLQGPLIIPKSDKVYQTLS